MDASHVELARNLLTNHRDDLKTLPSAFRARSELASIPHIPPVRNHLAPSYGSDLGVRRSADPRNFLHGILRALGIEPTAHELAWDDRHIVQAWGSEELTLTQMTAVFDTLISFWGMWTEAAHLATKLVASPRPVDGYRLLTYMAAAMSASGDAGAEDLFAAAVRSRDATGATSAMAQVRLAAWTIKRNNAPERGLSILDELESDVARGQDTFALTHGDHSVLVGVACNLRALVASRAKDVPRAMSLLSKARDHLAATGLVVVGEDERRRYFAQVSVNKAQLYALSGATAEAASTARTNVEWARENHAPSLSEALGVAGYTQYLFGQFDAAIENLSEAESLVVEEGTPARLAMVRKNLVGALHKSGQDRVARNVLRSITEDPVGVNYFADKAGRG